MLKTVKSKVLSAVFVMLAVSAVSFLCCIQIFKSKTEQLMLKNYSYSINTFVRDIDEKILRFEDNAADLARIGSLFYRTDRSIKLTKEALTKIFTHYKGSLGGGIWFEPYTVNKNEKRFCFYIYRNKNNKLVFDKNFSSEEYNYHNQSWYKEITSQITPENNTAWSKPYYENQGSNTMMITIGSGIYDGDKLIGISTVDWELGSVFKDISEMKPIENGFKFFEKRQKIKNSFSVFADKKYNYIIASDDPYLDNDALSGEKLENIPWYNENLSAVTYFKYRGKLYAPYVKTLSNGMQLIVCIPKDEMFKDIDKFTVDMFIVLSLLSLLIPVLLYAILNKNLIKPVNKLIDTAEKISSGEDIKIKIENPLEFARLAAAFDKMTENVKSAAAEKEKISAELSIAELIQKSSLPNVFPPFPDRKDFDIYASMEPAKEVGGDFYDFYFTDKNKFMFLIADVSGKGIPAALFMMTVKTLINNIAQTNSEPAEFIKTVNKKICANNQPNLFVTALIGIADIENGVLNLINCGHNPPLIKHKNGVYEYLKPEANLPLGVLDDFDFKIYETKLEEGGIIFTYTDGVTEAVNTSGGMYSEKRLLEFLNNNKDNDNVKELIIKMKDELKTYSSGLEQSDDITMLAFKYNSKQTAAETYKAEARIENYADFAHRLYNSLKNQGASETLINKISLCAEEIFVNTASYAYSDTGIIEVSLIKENNEITLTFKDEGAAYNPLEKPDPDINLSAEERQIGGLGIYIVKQMTKNVLYERRGNSNVLTLIFECG